jgi:hypothetical protein
MRLACHSRHLTKFVPVRRFVGQKQDFGKQHFMTGALGPHEWLFDLMHTGSVGWFKLQQATSQILAFLRALS